MMKRVESLIVSKLTAALNPVHFEVDIKIFVSSLSD